MTTDTQREGFRKHAVDNGLLYIGKDNLATCVQNLEKHQRDFNAGWQAALSQQPVGEEDIARVLDPFFKCDGFGNNTFDIDGASRELLARFNISERGK